jgi:hypothetical protein
MNIKIGQLWYTVGGMPVKILYENRVCDYLVIRPESCGTYWVNHDGESCDGINTNDLFRLIKNDPDLSEAKPLPLQMPPIEVEAFTNYRGRMVWEMMCAKAPKPGTYTAKELKDFSEECFDAWLRDYGPK